MGEIPGFAFCFIMENRFTMPLWFCLGNEAQQVLLKYQKQHHHVHVQLPSYPSPRVYREPHYPSLDEISREMRKRPHLGYH